jgi:hypothetical protein
MGLAVGAAQAARRKRREVKRIRFMRWNVCR